MTSYDPSIAAQAEEQCRLGATDEELAEYFHVDVRTIYRWRNRYPEFATAVVAGKAHADDRVERAFYARAVGCSVPAVKIFRGPADPEPVQAEYRRHFPPDTNAALQWLRVRRPKSWLVSEANNDYPEILAQVRASAAELKAREPE